MPAWPSSLQQLVDSQSFTLKLGDTTIRTDMDIGPAKVRRRFTKSVDTMNVTIQVDSDQFEDLYDFYYTTLNGGVDSFTFDHPITGVEVDIRFVAPPNFRPLGGLIFLAQMEWEILP